MIEIELARRWQIRARRPQAFVLFLSFTVRLFSGIKYICDLQVPFSLVKVASTESNKCVVLVVADAGPTVFVS